MSIRGFHALFRRFSGRGLSRNRNQVELKFARQLGDAFAGRPRQREELVYAAELYSTDRCAEALPWLEELMGQCAGQADRRAVLLFTALCRADLGDGAGAEAAYRSLLYIDPENSTALSNLGLLLQKKGKYMEAEGFYQRAMNCDPDNAYPYNNLAGLYHAMGEFDMAIPYAKKALEKKGNLYQAAALLAMCHTSLGNREEGERYSKIAVANGQEPEALARALKGAWAGRFVGPAVSQDLEKLLPLWKQRTGLHSNMVYVGKDRVGRSRFGGALGEAPLDGNGKPMRLLCAIFCEEFTESILPREGVLRFYISCGEVFGTDFDHPTRQTGFRVLYDREYGHLTEGEDPGPDPQFPVGGCYGLRCGPAYRQAMPRVDHRFDDVFYGLLQELGVRIDGDGDIEALEELFSPEGHRVGGYPHFTQFDPRERPGLERYDTLLLQVDSMDILDMHIDIGDSGVMNFFIPKEKLDRRDFSDVLFWWDCY